MILLTVALLALVPTQEEEPVFSDAIQARLTALAACTSHAINAMAKTTEAHAAATAAIAGCSAERDAIAKQMEADVADRDHISAGEARKRVEPFMPKLDGIIAKQVLHYAVTYGGMTAKDAAQ